MPFSSNEYWFFTCYLIVLIFAPFLNEFVTNSSKRDFQKLLTGLFLLVCFLPTVLYFHPLGSGKNLLNIVFIYLLGGYLRRFNIEEVISKFILLIGAFGSFLFIFLSDLLLSLLTGSIHIPFARDCSMFVVLEAVSIFFLFKNNVFHSTLLNKISKHVFAVYLFEGAFRVYIFSQFIDLNSFISSSFWPLTSLLISLVTLICCILIDIPVNYMINRFIKRCGFLSKICDNIFSFI